MSKLLRYYSEGQVYFITSVTYQRKSILLDHPEIWLRAIRETKDDETFNLIAWVLMPDHFHIITQPRGCNPDKILKHIKLIYSHNYRKVNGLYKYKIWQARFWDHVIRNQKDLDRHIDYIHYNSVKHGYVDNPFDWEYSSIHKYYSDGFYSSGWGTEKRIRFDGCFGE